MIQGAELSSQHLGPRRYSGAGKLQFTINQPHTHLHTCVHCKKEVQPPSSPGCWLRCHEPREEQNERMEVAFQSGTTQGLSSSWH